MQRPLILDSDIVEPCLNSPQGTEGSFNCGCCYWKRYWFEILIWDIDLICVTSFFMNGRLNHVRIKEWSLQSDSGFFNSSNFGERKGNSSFRENYKENIKIFIISDFKGGQLSLLALPCGCPCLCMSNEYIQYSNKWMNNKYNFVVFMGNEWILFNWFEWINLSI